METKSLIWALVIGMLIAAASVGLYLFMYLVVLAGQPDLVRLLGAFFVPIVAMILLIGAYFLLRNRD
jgi:heme/copper-type cytochrome/quinol oxidase subunit 4